MIGWFAACAFVFAAGGIAGGAYLACRFAWPRRIYEMLFAARP
jgi:hypothetical protein